MTIDPRLIERRQTVAEENAHRSMGRLLRFLGAILLVGGVVWLMLSPWLSVARVRTAGIISSSAHVTLAEHGVVAGTPMVFLKAGKAEAALESDPWILDARVARDWPDEVVVQVIERVPVIWVQSAEGWSWRAIDGVAVPGPDGPDELSPRLLAPGTLESDLDESLLVEGAAEFVVSLPEGLAQGLILEMKEGELWADIEGHAIRLGRPVEMEAKALSLGALLREDIPEGSTLILVAPTNPAVEMPDARPAETEEVETGDEAGGEETGDG